MMTRQRGVALISVLLIVVAATALAYEMATRHTLNIAQSRLLLNGSQARQYALGGEEYARQILYADWEDEETRAYDTLQESWASAQGRDRTAKDEEDDGDRWAEGDEAGQGGQADVDPQWPSTLEEESNRRGDAADSAAARSQAPARTFEVDDGSLIVRIDDLAGRFNLNAVAGGAGKAGEKGAENLDRFKRLLQQTGIDSSVADAWRDWVDNDEDIHGYGAEDADHMRRAIPQRAANQRAIHVSELLVATSISPLEFEELRRHVAVLPVSYLRVNVNTASAAVLQALAPNFNKGEARRLTEGPREFKTIEELVAQQATLGQSVEALSVQSEFFRVQVRAEYDDAVAELTSLVYRDSSSGAMTVLSRNFGETFGATPIGLPDGDDEPEV